MPFPTSGLKSLAVAASLAALALPAPALVDFGEGGEVAGAPAMVGQAFPDEPKPAGATDMKVTEDTGADTKYHALDGPGGVPLLMASRTTPEAGCIRRGDSPPTGGTLNCADNAIDQSPGWTAMRLTSFGSPSPGRVTKGSFAGPGPADGVPTFRLIPTVLELPRFRGRLRTVATKHSDVDALDLVERDLFL